MFLPLLLATALAAEPPKPPVQPAADPHDVVRFDVDEATWSNVDVHPSGDRVAFDLLGHVYVVPLAGGRARRLTDGHAWNMHPRWSPDGKRLAFVSDRDGGDNLWVMRADGSDARAVSTESFQLVTQPDWTPDGRWIYGRRHVTGTRSLGTGEIWAWPADGKGKGVRWTEAGHKEADVNEPHVDPTGTWLYTTVAGPFDYNRNVYAGIYGLERVHLQTGVHEDVAGGPGGAIRAAVSPDGRTLGYLRRHLDGQRTTWVLRDLERGGERVVFEDLDRDQQETWAIHGTAPAWSWLPDSSGAVFAFDGGLHVVGRDGEVRTVRWTAEVERPVVEALRQRHDLAPDRFTARVIRWPSLGPDRRTLLFQAVGRVWLREPGQAPVALGPPTGLSFAPTWRPDGGAVAFTTWDDARGGMLWVQEVERGRPSGLPQPVGDVPDLYTNPSFGHDDGMRLLWVQGTGTTNRGSTGLDGQPLRVRWRIAPDGEVHDAGTVRPRGAGVRAPRPVFDATGERILVTDVDGDDTVLVSMDLHGRDRRVLARGAQAAEIAPSPDGRWIAWKTQHQVYVAAWPPTAGRPLVLGEPGDAVPAVRLSEVHGEWLSWTDADTLTWASGPDVYRVDLSGGLPEAPSTPTPKATKGQPWPSALRDPVGTRLPTDLKVARPVHDQVLALTGARLLTLRGDEVVEDGVLVVRGERIVAVGPRATTVIPDGAVVIDVGGRTVMPGLVDVHAHMGYGHADVSPETIPAYAANLAYGVTTTHDPSAETLFVFGQRELELAGRVVGPRILSTGFVLYGADHDDRAVVESLDDARRHVQRLAAYGAQSVKSYNQPRRDQRQWILRAAREAGLLVVPEGGSTLQHDLTMIVDGHTGIEHALPVEQLHEDVVRLWGANPGVHYTPTLLVGYGGVWGEHAFYQRQDVWRIPRLQRFTRPGVLEARGKRLPLRVPEEDWHHVRLAQT
ncbi:MAG: PD40 domain-containing protein, partial [Alphaproteobacteria bacterium]|nr:PD40 domain-containing protein [Alphaproteobacteria bacterium]